MQSLLPFITGSGGALVVLSIWLYVFLTGKLHTEAEYSKLEEENKILKAEIEGLRLALSTERRTVNETANAGQVTNQLIAALTSLAAERKGVPLELTAKDVGL